MSIFKKGATFTSYFPRPKLGRTASILLALFSLLSSGSAGAVHALATGTFVEHFNQAQTSDSGALKKFELTPYIAYGYPFRLNGAHYFTPELGLAYPLTNAKKTKKNIIFLRYIFSAALSDSFLLRYGLSTYWLTISGDGGTLNLRNGTTRSNFPAPDRPATSYFTTADLGGEYFFNRKRSVRFDLNVMNLFDFSNRAYNYILTYNWYF